MHQYVVVGAYSLEVLEDVINTNSRKGYEVCFYSTCLDVDGNIYFSAIMRLNG